MTSRKLIFNIYLRKPETKQKIVWRYQRSNQNPKIEDEQTR